MKPVENDTRGGEWCVRVCVGGGGGGGGGESVGEWWVGVGVYHSPNLLTAIYKQWAGVGEWRAGVGEWRAGVGGQEWAGRSGRAGVGEWRAGVGESWAGVAGRSGRVVGRSG